MAAGRASRAAALAILRDVRAGRLWDDALAAAVSPLADDDARLAHEIAAGVLRLRRPLDASLAPRAARWDRTSDDLKDLLRIGAFQLRALDRVPPYAAVQATVDVAKTAVGVKESRFVNAVLRRYADEAPPDTPPDPVATHPDWLVARWTARYGADATARLTAHNDRRPDLTVMPMRWSTERLAQAFADRDIAFHEAATGAGLVVDARRVADLPGFAEGAFIVQDPAQHALLDFARLPTDGWIWDACAAPGGKAVWLARTHTVFASDRHPERLALARATARRCGVRVPLAVLDASAPPVRAEQFAGVLVDAPCSATGTMRRHPDARWRLDEDRIRTAVRWQAAILDGVAPTVRVGGLLVYLTCSLEPEENDEQVDRFLDRHANFRRTEPDRVIFPPESDTDGGFGARLERVG